MAYWLYVTNSANWQITRKTNILAAAERHRKALSRLQVGDRCLIYVKSEYINKGTTPPRIVGEYEIYSPVFEEKTRIFQAPRANPNETFNLRIELKPLEIFRTPVNYASLVPRLSFIKNKKHWGGTLQGNVVFNIPKEDFEIFTKAASQ